MSYKLKFCFPEQPEIVLMAFVSAKNENEAKDRFKIDYPNFVGCEILQVIPYKD
ncbi:hypothetical protein J5Y03_10175 [Bacillus sp. RG28]|uniref:Uncharacterized protein n=1 Tax=Gottfriedia endophytica TaxID=2820819 RepID=A0A940SK28_9BACI|nr:hypothetical protein [Gottfriedia endophytica]MBP0725554.1 hypothetical protein [Gottfriedia endophytica]